MDQHKSETRKEGIHFRVGPIESSGETGRLTTMSDDKKIRVYDLHDRSQYADDKAYWDAQSAVHKLAVLEQIRLSALKLSNKESGDGDAPGLRRVLRISQLK